MQLLLLGTKLPHRVPEGGGGQAGADQGGGQGPDGANLHVHRAQQVRVTHYTSHVFRSLRWSFS